MILTISKEDVRIPAERVVLDGHLILPAQSHAAVIFAHGSGSSRLSPRNTYVANTLTQAGISTLLFDLLTSEEDADYENRFNIDLLTRRLKAATKWLQAQRKDFVIGYFGASTGTASALRAAADLADEIGAVVSRGGRPDMAGPALARVKAPVLLIVGGSDHQVIDLNRQAYDVIKTEKELSIIPAATHLFEERGALEEVAAQAARWFTKHLLASAR